MAASTVKLTIEDFEQLPEELARNHELVEGELVEVPGNVFVHQLVCGEFAARLLMHVKPHGLGIVLTEQEYDFEGNAHAPDISFFGPGKTGLVERKRRVQRFVPDIAIEIASQNDRHSELFAKIARYRRCGVAEVWLLSLDVREAFFYSAEGNRILGETDFFRSAFLPGFEIRLGDLFDL